MEYKLKTTVDLLEIFLNFMLILGLETVAQAMSESAFGGGTAPPYAFFIPLSAPLAFYAARRVSKNLALFLTLHAAVVVALNYLAGFLPVPILWKIVFTAVGIIYAVISVRVRLTGREDREGEATPGLMAAAALVFFLTCSYLGNDAGCVRILRLMLLWFPGYLMKSYLDNFLSYLKMNRQASGAMPEKRILSGGIFSVAAYCGFCLAVLTVYSRTELVAKLSELVRKAGYLLLRLFFGMLAMFSKDTEGIQEASDGSRAYDQAMQLPDGGEAPWWMQLLDKILVTATAILIIAGIILLAVLLIRYMIRSFYGREKEKKEVRQEGFVEEEERLAQKKHVSRTRLPVIGGTPAQRVRKIFKKTVRGVLKKENAASEELNAKTVRELAKLCVENASGVPSGMAEWDALANLYEKARYSEKTVTNEEAREAGRLSGKLLRS